MPDATRPKSGRRKPPSPAVQKTLVNRGRVVSSATQSFFGRRFRESVALANARLTIVYGVLFSSGFCYISGITSQWAPILSQPQMYCAAATFGAAAGVILARSLPWIRQFEREESDRARAKEDALGVVERINIIQPVLRQLPAPDQRSLLNATIFPSLSLRAPGQDAFNAEPEKVTIPIENPDPAPQATKKQKAAGPGITDAGKPPPDDAAGI